jgi:hypothetical protein
MSLAFIFFVEKVENIGNDEITCTKASHEGSPDTLRG